MARQHEIKDPIHGFVRLSEAERRLLDTAPVQRLRHIHQLALSSRVYPGATHRRFEHSLGVMHLAGRAYDALAANAERFGGALSPEEGPDPGYWRRALRAAALLHDVGHLPFSHAAEALLPPGLDHEDLSGLLIRSEHLRPSLEALALVPADVARLAVGQPGPGEPPLSGWECALSSLLVGDAFGADRVDYLLRDAHHSGAVLGSFDHERLIGRLCLLPGPGEGEGGGQRAPVVGLHSGGLQAAEGLLTTRDALYEALYFHPVRRISDHHLGQFLQSALGTPLLPQGDPGSFSADLERHLSLTDDEVSAAIRRANADPRLPGHRWARRLERREHFRLLYRSRGPHNPLVREVAVAAREEFGPASIVYDPVERRPGRLDFPLLSSDGSVRPVSERSRLLRELPPIQVEYVFIAPELRDRAREWVRGVV